MNEKTVILAEGIRNSKRDCLARAITLIESTNKEHRIQAKLLLEAIAFDRNALDCNVKPTVRLGIAGPPGKLLHILGTCYSSLRNMDICNCRCWKVYIY